MTYQRTLSTKLPEKSRVRSKAKSQKLEAELKNCQIIDEEKSDDKVVFGSVVTLKDLEYDEELEYSS